MVFLVVDSSTGDLVCPRPATRRSRSTQATQSTFETRSRGFGARSEERILRGIELLRQSGERVLLSIGLETADEMMTALRTVPGCVRCAYAGSLRRMRETVGDVDILAAVAAGPGDGAAGPGGGAAGVGDGTAGP